jgi:hypothetical protein
VLCQQTQDLVTARDWLDTLTAGGIEGVVIKDPTGTYPATDGPAMVEAQGEDDAGHAPIGFTDTSGTSDAPGLAGPRLSGRGR